MKKIQIVFISILLIFAACDKDQQSSGELFIPIDSGELIASKVLGQVIDEEGLPVSAAIVRFQQATSMTNEDGVFSFDRMNLESNGQVLSVEKEGFFINYKKIIPTPDDTFLKVGLVAKSEPTGSFSAIDGGVIEKPDSEQITFSPNAIRTENGENYEGEVTVYSHHFNPEEAYFHETMPGDLSAISKLGEVVQLATYSMILVELFGESGEKLNLKDNTTATVAFPIKGIAPERAPLTIPLWSLDENTGTWVEELQATKQDNYYIGKVDHFSFWNCDVPFELVNLQGTVVDQNGNPVSNASVSIQIANGGAVRNARTNLAGMFTGNIPKNEELVLNISQSDICTESIYSENIGPFSTDQTLNTTVELGTDNGFVVTGTLKDCSEGVVASGYVVLSNDSGQSDLIPINSDGAFTHTSVFCQGSEMTIYGVDLQNNAKTPTITLTNSGQSNEELGDLVACQFQDEYLTVFQDGVPVFSSENAFTAVTENGFEFLTRDINLGPQIAVIRHEISPVNETSLVLILDPANLYLGCGDVIWNINNPHSCPGNYNFEIEQYDNFEGGYIQGTGTGNLWNNSTLIPASIEFRYRVDAVVTEYSGTVWNDLNENGIHDANEPGIQNAAVNYTYTSSGDGGSYSPNTVPTDENGNYKINLSVTNSGTLKIELPEGYVTTLQNQGTDESTDSDFPQGVSGDIEFELPIQDFNTPNLLDLGIHLE